MPRDAREEEVTSWLERARQDLSAAAVDLHAEPPLLADAAFHCQQAVEKSVKALLTRHERPFRGTHDIGELGLLAATVEPALTPLLQRSAPLTEYAWRFRYPGDVFEPPRDEVDEALALARQVVAAITERI